VLSLLPEEPISRPEFSQLSSRESTREHLTPFGSKLPFGEPVAEVDTDGWVQSIKWSPSGNQLAWASHDSTVTVADASSGQLRPSVIRYNDLPLRDLIFINEGAVVGAGHDCTPMLFANQGGWKLVKKLDQGGGATGPAPAASGAASARNLFQAKDTRGEDKTETKLTTKHQNCITCVQKYGSGGYSTTGMDGNIVIWDAPK